MWYVLQTIGLDCPVRSVGAVVRRIAANFSAPVIIIIAATAESLARRSRQCPRGSLLVQTLIRHTHYVSEAQPIRAQTVCAPVTTDHAELVELFFSGGSPTSDVPLFSTEHVSVPTIRTAVRPSAVPPRLLRGRIALLRFVRGAVDR